MERFDYLIVGGGPAAAHAAVGVRELDAEGSVGILCEEGMKPYDRPPLSKGMLFRDDMTPEDAESKDPSFYTENRIDVRTGSAVEHVETADRRVRLHGGETLRYDKLLLAPGAKPRTLSLGHERTFTLRSASDAFAIREAALAAEQAVIVGAGYLGVEVASSLRKMGVEVAMVEIGPHPWARFASEATGGVVRAALERHGVQMVVDDEAAGFDGFNVRTRQGENLPADFVVVAIGVEPNVALANRSDIRAEPGKGIWVDEFLATSDPNVFAAGDAAYFPDPLGGRCRAEHHLNAKWQGRRAGRNMAGEGKPFEEIAYFFSDFLDLHMILRGSPEGAQPARTIGDVDAGDYVELYAGEDGVLRMALAVSPEEPKLDPISDRLEELLRARTPVTEVEL
jgi:NADPH-dependent 2,4-dienoyl-CoA reductase/sulfur reductase-like enzyme